MWLILHQDRGLAFLYACICGVVIGALYDVFRVFRAVFEGGRIRLFFEDLLFCLMAALVFVVYCFNATMGVVRMFSALGALFGFFVYRYSLGLFTVSAAKRLKVAIALPLGRLKLYIRGKLLAYNAVFYTFRCKRRAWHCARCGFKA